MKLLRALIICLVVILGIGLLRLPVVRGVTGIAQKTINIVNSSGTVMDGVASAVTGVAHETVNIADSTGHIIDNFGTFVAGKLVPSSGGVGAMTSAPMWARYFGTGSDGAGPASGAISTSLKNYTSWTCTGAITLAAGKVSVILSQGTVALNTGCSVTETTGNSTASNDIGGAGGSGGSGAGNSTATAASAMYGNTAGSQNSVSISAAASASAAGAGNDGGAITTDNINGLLFSGPLQAPFNRGGGKGSQGGSAGGALGNGGNGVFIIAPTITIASGVTIDVSGFPGVAAAANSTGAGGGGGGGVIVLSSESLTDNGGIFKYGGGPGGAITQPSVQAIGGGCDSGTNGCGKDAVFTVTGLTTGGLDATKITVTNAGTGYQTAPGCQVNAGGSGLIGSPACHFAAPIAGALAAPIIDTPGTTGVLTTYTVAFVGGYGANGWMRELTIQ